MPVVAPTRRSPSSRRGTVHVCAPDGAGPMRHRELHLQVRRAITSGATTLVVEVRRSQVLTSADVATLLWANRHCLRRGGRVVVTADRGSDLGLLGSTCLGDVVTVTERAGSAA